MITDINNNSITTITVDHRTAKEMFEELEYVRTTRSEKNIVYTYRTILMGDFNIIFDLEDETIEFWIDKTNPFQDEPFQINVKELQAINKQVEELGWK